MKQPALLGIDAGSSSVKICAFTPRGEMLGGVNKPVLMHCEPDGTVSFNPRSYWDLCCGLVRDLMKTRDMQILGVGLSTACPSMVFMDHDFNPVRPGIPYLDNRASAEVSSLQNQGLELENPYSVSSCSIANAMWVKKHEPEIWKQTEKIGMLNSYLAGKITGESMVDLTQASYSGIFDLKTPDRWNRDALEMSGIEETKLLPLSRSYEKAGSVTADAAEKTGLPEGCPVAIGSADTAAAAFAVALDQPGWAFESVGTSGVLTFALDKPEFDPVFMNRCHVYPDRWLAHGAMSLTGGALEWLRRKVWDEFTAPADMDRILDDSTPGAGGVVFLPYLAGERSPIWDPEAVGVWYGMTLGTSKADLIEAVYESSAYGMKQILDLAARKYGQGPDFILSVGNGTKGARWNQIKSDVLQLPYRPVSNADAAAFGAAMMGGIAGGLFTGPQDPAVPRLKKGNREFLPCGEEEYREYMNSYKIYKALYPALKNVMHSR